MRRRSDASAAPLLRIAMVLIALVAVAVSGSARAQLPGSDLPPPPGGSPATPAPTLDRPATPTPSPSPASPSAEGSEAEVAPEQPTPAAPAAAPQPPQPTPTGGATTAMVIDAATSGIDPRVGQHVTYVMRRTLFQMGYTITSAEATVAAAQQVRMPYPPSPADLWRVTQAAEVDRTAFARVWAQNGRYVFEFTVASADGSGPFFARGTSGSEDLYAVVENLTREAVPPRDRWDADAAARYRQPQRYPSASASPAGPSASPQTRMASPIIRPVESSASEEVGRRFQLSVFSLSAIGADGSGFYNHLIDLGLGFRINRRNFLSLRLAYANLNGRDNREHNLLPMLEYERRLFVSHRFDLAVTIKGAVGFLPYNGPTVRFSAGLSYAFSERVEVGADLVAPMFWFVEDTALVSMNVALGLVIRL